LKPKLNALSWLHWAREIQALAQTGLHYAENDFQRERNARLLEIAAEMISEHANLEAATLKAIFREQTGYATPRVDVRGAVFHEGKLLLVKEREDNAWTLPGGWADVGDRPSAAVEREVWEESGLRVKAVSVIGVYDANRVGPLALFHAFKIVFLCDWIAGQLRSSNETSEAAFFEADEIPHTFSGERTKPRHIQDAFRALANPTQPVVFD